MDRTGLVDVPSAEIADGICQLHALLMSVFRHLLEWIAAYDEQGSWSEDGATSVTAWLAATLHVQHDTAAEWVRVAKALAELPRITQAFEDGTLSFDQVRQLSRFATPETDAALAEEAGRLSATQLRRMARRARPVPAEEDAEAHRLRRLRLRWELDRSVLLLSGRLPAAEGAVVEKTLKRIADQAPPNPETGWYEPIDTRQADALVALSSAKLAEDSDADRATLSVHVDASVLAGGEGLAEVEGGAALPLEAAVRMACDARWQVIVDGPDGAPLGIGRMSRQVPGWMARQLRHRDGGCRFPGCERKGWVSAHHVRHWCRGGHTNLDNLLLLCGVHHRIVHEGGWTIEGDPDGQVRFVRPDGRVYEARPPPLRSDIKRRIVGDADGQEPQAG